MKLYRLVPSGAIWTYELKFDNFVLVIYNSGRIYQQSVLSYTVKDNFREVEFDTN